MTELKQVPTEQEMQLLIGAKKYSAWKGICAVIESIYDMDCQWNDGGKSRNMSTNTVVAGRRYAHYTQSRIALAS